MNTHWKSAILIGLLAGSGLRLPAERINHEGRILGPLPVVTSAILFNTTNADAVVAAMQIFPVTSPWNEDISGRPVLTNSDAMIAQIIADLDTINPNRRTLRAFYEMNYVLVPDNQPVRPIHFVEYLDESDLDGGTEPFGLYPIPTNQPIETWPYANTNTLLNWQADLNGVGGDRHAIIVQPGNELIWETWQSLRTGTNWQASNGAKFDLKSNALRPNGWTSGDAAGLPMFPALPRFDECERGMVEHACRVVVHRSRYNRDIYPATHYAAPTNNTSANLPAMGQRLRLKAGFLIPPTWSKHEKAVLLALKKYGAIVADNGGFFSISVTPDDRWTTKSFWNLPTVGITNFEVIQTTGTNEGPRSPGAPTADAGPDRVVPAGVPISLQGFVNFTGNAPTNEWKVYSGPGPVEFSNAAQTNTVATFSAPGAYTLLLGAADGVHTVAYDAAVFTVTNAFRLSAALAGTNLVLTWTGGTAPFVVERADVAPGVWSGVVTTGVQSITLPRTDQAKFFRVRWQ